MLVLIFGCLVAMLMNGRKQIEALREGPPILTSGTSNDDASIRRAYPSLRSSRTPPPAKVIAPEVSKPETVPTPAPVQASAEPSVVAEQPPVVLPVATVQEPADPQNVEPGISGHVYLIGSPPPEIPIRFDAVCGRLNPQRVTTKRYVVSPDGGLANVFVYISKGAEKLKSQPALTPVLLNQTNCMYEPYILGAMVNQPIQIKNSDPVLHNVHAFPRADRNGEFNFAQPLQNQIDERKFSRPELFIKVKCDVHDWMLSYVSVLSHPYFAITDTNGFFELPSGLPPGKYEITVAHLKAGTASQTILLKKSNNVRLDFKLPVSGKSWLALRAP